VARTKSPRADEDALDPVEAADVEHADDPDAGLLELDPEADLDADDTDDADELATDETDDDEDEEDDGDPAALDAHPDGSDEDDPVGVVVLPDAAFDEDDDEVTAAVVDIDDDDGDEIEGVRDGEFVCRRCYMAKRETQLVDAERLLCRDCA
jgi:hypothetical protein